jgi:hypothetical protein
MSRTNTPLQALTLLNDQTMREASQALAAEMLVRSQPPSQRLDWLTRQVLSRPATAQEIQVLSRELDRALKHYRHQPGDAEKFLGQKAPPELAAHTLIASLVLNLDEALTHE